MDERRRLETTLATGAAVPASPRGTPWWLQLFVCLAIIGGAGAAWGYFYPGGRETLAGWGIMLPGVAAPDAESQSAQGGPNADGGNPAAGNPGGGFRRPGGNRSVQVVVTAPVTSAVINDRLMAIGEGTAASAVTVTSAAGGTLTELFVAPGDVVKANAVIGQLDARSEQIAFDRASLAAKDANEALARATELRQAQSVSNVQLAAAQLAADQAGLELRNAELALERRKITTPIAGTVGLLQVTPGNLVNAQTIVTTVEDSSEILINFWVPERYASAIALGMPVEASAVAIPGQTFAGKVDALDNRIDVESRTLQVQARIANPDGRIRAGMSFQVAMSFPGDAFAAVDPLSIQWSSEGAYVWKLIDGKVERASVSIIERNSGGVLVSGDVAEGDQVVTQGVLQLQPGASVRLLDAPPEGGPHNGGQPGGQGGQGTAAPL